MKILVVTTFATILGATSAFALSPPNAAQDQGLATQSKSVIVVARKGADDGANHDVGDDRGRGKGGKGRGGRDDGPVHS